jgi:hypothetical protein
MQEKGEKVVRIYRLQWLTIYTLAKVWVMMHTPHRSFNRIRRSLLLPPFFLWMASRQNWGWTWVDLECSQRRALLGSLFEHFPKNLGYLRFILFKFGNISTIIALVEPTTGPDSTLVDFDSPEK